MASVVLFLVLVDLTRVAGHVTILLVTIIVGPALQSTSGKKFYVLLVALRVRLATITLVAVLVTDHMGLVIPDVVPLMPCPRVLALVCCQKELHLHAVVSSVFRKFLLHLPLA